MSFSHPLRLVIAVAGVALIAVLYRMFERRKTSREVAYSNLAFLVEATRSGAWAAWMLLAAWLVASAFIAVAFAGVHVRTWVPAKDGYVFICIDTSGSMASTDVTPTRAGAARAAARAFVAKAPAGVKIGIIAFATEAAVVQPLSANRETVAQSIDAIPLPNGATAIGDALALGQRLLPAHGHRAIVLITDGESNRGTDPMSAAQNLAAHHVTLYTVGIGTNSGAIVPGTNQVAGIDEDALRAYAQATGGAYVLAADAGSLQRALARLGRTTTFELRNIDASLPAALVGSTLMIAVFLTGLGLGRFP